MLWITLSLIALAALMIVLYLRAIDKRMNKQDRIGQ